jgi:hypothetical protein
MYLFFLVVILISLCLYQLLTFSNIIEGLNTNTLSSAQKANLTNIQKNIINSLTPAAYDIIKVLTNAQIIAFCNYVITNGVNASLFASIGATNIAYFINSGLTKAQVTAVFASNHVIGIQTFVTLMTTKLSATDRPKYLAYLTSLNIIQFLVLTMLINTAANATIVNTLLSLKTPSYFNSLAALNPAQQQSVLQQPISTINTILSLSFVDLDKIVKLTQNQIVAAYLLGGAGSASTINTTQLLNSLQTLYNNNETCQKNYAACQPALANIIRQNDTCNLNNSYLQLNKTNCDNFITNQSKIFSIGVPVETGPAK